VAQNALDYLETPRLTSCSSGSLSLHDRLEIAMTDVSSKPVRRMRIAELTFEELLDSDEAAPLLKIHPKTLQKMDRNGDHRRTSWQTLASSRIRSEQLTGTQDGQLMLSSPYRCSGGPPCQPAVPFSRFHVSRA
jgi:hypothetical protein